MSDRIPEMPFINHEQDGQRLVADLCSIPDEAALATAIFFEDTAKKLRERHEVWQREQALKRHTQSKLASTTRLPGRVMDRMLNGHSFEEAAELVADNHGIPRETVYHYWLTTIGAIENRAKIARNSQIWQLYQEGFTDTEIASHVNLSERQVRRIIQKNKSDGK